jgi:hypothetical protein
VCVRNVTRPNLRDGHRIRAQWTRDRIPHGHAQYAFVTGLRSSPGAKIIIPERSGTSVLFQGNRGPPDRLLSEDLEQGARPARSRMESLRNISQRTELRGDSVTQLRLLVLLDGGNRIPYALIDLDIRRTTLG